MTATQPVEFAVPPLNGRARSHGGLLSERQGRTSAVHIRRPAVELALLILLDGLLRTYLPSR
jgi:hypothetical protein